MTNPTDRTPRPHEKPADRGFLRDDGQDKPNGGEEAPLDRKEVDVLDRADDRHPNAPDTVDADKGGA